MNIFISTNPFIQDKFSNVFKVLEILKNKVKENIISEDEFRKVGIEVFPNFDNELFSLEIKELEEEIKKYPTALHGPYFKIEHSGEKGSLEYSRAKEEFIKILELGKKIDAKHIVYHHNNKIVSNENKEEIIKHSRENLKELNKIAEEYSISILVENAGVNSIGNNLFTEDEFINEVKNIENSCLIDVGHAHANLWNLDNVITALSEKIEAYHLHNNDKLRDLHESIDNGSLSFDDFFETYKKNTNKADLVLEYGYQYNDKIEKIAEDVIYIIEKLRHN